jgi:hypothetical protein
MFDVLLAMPVSQSRWSCSPSQGLLQVKSEVQASSFKPVVFDGVRAVADKGDHRHIGEREEAYGFTTVEQLLADFERDVRNWRSS